MNEQIEGLWWKARIGYNNQQVDPEVLAKFAELIVKETMQVVANNLPSNTYLDVADAVIEHFGVEE